MTSHTGVPRISIIHPLLLATRTNCSGKNGATAKQCSIFLTIADDLEVMSPTGTQGPSREHPEK